MYWNICNVGARHLPSLEHKPFCDPCLHCGRLASEHKPKDRAEYQRAYRKKNNKHINQLKRQWREFNHPERQFIGIDGEGWTDKKTGKHYYSYMAACDPDKLIADIFNPRGLTTNEIFQFLVDLPEFGWQLKVGFSLGYDITKWFENLPNSTIWLLNHPEYRKETNPKAKNTGPKDIRYMDYSINRMSSKFSLSKYDGVERKRLVIWDLFRFFGKAFVPSLEDWQVGTPEKRAEIQRMKDERGNFKEIGPEEQLYCQDECKLLAKLAQTLVDAHTDADIKLTSYYGPGSTATTMLKKMKAKEETAIIPREMAYAVECAFFGGRFERKQLGPIKNVHKYDIASAYPYAMVLLPCLKHGKWELLKNPSDNDIEKAPAACIKYELPPYQGLRILANVDPDAVKSHIKIYGMVADEHWGPFPFRNQDGNIIFPVTSLGGWIWKPEYEVAKRHWPNVVAREAWILKQDCDCGKPFARAVATYYNRRLEWGKEGRGIALKLGINSCYGKRAQRVGTAPFKCVVSAGIITSTCRSMGLEGIAQAPHAIVDVATDSLESLVELNLPLAVPTGTESMAIAKKKKPLGAWDYKGTDDIQSIRPGMQFSLKPDADRSTTSARGLGVRILHENKDLVLAHWDIAPMSDVHITQPTIFMGSKTSIRISTDGRKAMELVRQEKARLTDIAAQMTDAFERDNKYGKWVKPKERLVSYSPMPKRPGYDPKTFQLFTWALKPEAGESVPYGKAEKSLIAKELEELRIIEEEQADQEGLHSFADQGNWQ